MKKPFIITNDYKYYNIDTKYRKMKWQTSFICNFLHSGLELWKAFVRTNGNNKQNHCFRTFLTQLLLTSWPFDVQTTHFVTFCNLPALSCFHQRKNNDFGWLSHWFEEKTFKIPALASTKFEDFEPVLEQTAKLASKIWN